MKTMALRMTVISACVGAALALSACGGTGGAWGCPSADAAADMIAALP